LAFREEEARVNKRASRITGNFVRPLLFSRTFMNKSLLLASLIAVAALAACSKKEEAPVAPAPVVEASAPAPAPVAPASEAASDAAAPASAASN
jgi:hypothetical protein